MPLLAIPFPAFNPVAVSLGPIAIRWYALAYIVGLLVGWRYCLALADRPPNIVRRGHVDDFLVWATLGVVLGGRVGYVLFYNLPYYLQHPLEALYLWHGGMSFHGGAIGVTIAIVLFTRAREIPVLAFSDIILEAIPIGLFFGRIANFINGELFGRITDVWWAMIFPNGAVSANQVPPQYLASCRQVIIGGVPALNCPRHPSELYEAVCEGALLFLLLFIAERRGARMRPGIVTGLFLIGYAVARMSGELFRQPDEQLGFLLFGTTMGQLLSIPVLIAGVAIIYLAVHRPALRGAAASEPR
ncbi:MAG TPA: prolipoprotein diacylglyceryl transferase [Stellaceae bacterium]|nr:prolipoprotein diacylglyceryl transferase [Stellaceae bacterium]